MKRPLRLEALDAEHRTKYTGSTFRFCCGTPYPNHQCDDCPQKDVLKATRDAELIRIYGEPHGDGMMDDIKEELDASVKSSDMAGNT